jgi:hypothetical protein
MHILLHRWGVFPIGNLLHHSKPWCPHHQPSRVALNITSLLKDRPNRRPKAPKSSAGKPERKPVVKPVMKPPLATIPATQSALTETTAETAVVNIEPIERNKEHAMRLQGFVNNHIISFIGEKKKDK